MKSTCPARPHLSCFTPRERTRTRRSRGRSRGRAGVGTPVGHGPPASAHRMACNLRVKILRRGAPLLPPRPRKSGRRARVWPRHEERRRQEPVLCRQGAAGAASTVYWGAHLNRDVSVVVVLTQPLLPAAGRKCLRRSAEPLPSLQLLRRPPMEHPNQGRKNPLRPACRALTSVGTLQPYFGEGAPLSAWGGARRPGGAGPVLASRLLQRMPGDSLRIHAARNIPFRDPRAGRDPPKVFWNPSLSGIVKLAATEMRVLVLGETLAGRVIVHGTWLEAAGNMAHSLAPAAVWSPPTFPPEPAGRNLPATPSRRLPPFAIRSV